MKTFYVINSDKQQKDWMYLIRQIIRRNCLIPENQTRRFEQGEQESNASLIRNGLFAL